MHAGAVYSCLWLGHKSSVKAMALGYGFYRHLKSKNIICRLQTFPVLEINFMLSGSHLMMGLFYQKSHILQVQNNITSHVLPLINGRHIKISRCLMGVSSWPSFVICMKQEELTFRAGKETISHLFCLPNHLLQHIPGVSLKRCSVRPIYVTHHTGNLSLLGPPRKDLKGIQIRIQIHI